MAPWGGSGGGLRRERMSLVLAVLGSMCDILQGWRAGGCLHGPVGVWAQSTYLNVSKIIEKLG